MTTRFCPHLEIQPCVAPPPVAMRGGIRLGFALLLLVLVALGGVWTLLERWRTTPLPVTETVSVQIPRGTGVIGAAERLAQTLGGETLLWRWLVWRERPERVIAGYYQFPPSVSPQEALAMVVRGEVIRDRITIVEGWTFRQMQAAIDAHPYLTHTLQGADEQTILSAIGAQVPYAEGWFFPDTYLFDRMTPDQTIYRQAHERMRRVLAEVWAGRDPDLPLESPEALLILASIVEKETAHPEDRGKVASVFLNRLRKGMPLQSDPTVIYGLGERYDGSLSKRDLRHDTAHNTYTRQGLPPSPIALPSLASLQAVAHPEKTDYLYFVASGTDATSIFSRTLTEHNRAVRAYRQAMRNAESTQ
ncbi:endolytic transglycosylase MltG [Hydrogenophilus thermoluteolus]|uniref:Endolytic murein transglycosylase n=1 Tax=Hydrogenophilus thermoluteolus TaxID=297 RepID=A0A2Z6DYF2_HYDTE|nr:endolytic transglycosylase MltG [Hydrogenophilus thermoluteolus]BBD77369.1 aminodeoxychorismate lyase [Hydrogenophilus thermoluteolus]